ncbi:MAG: GntR family transcriptional regulator, partial [Victivallales bacterium]|nr:GntR family transcriptional regulator [Victivallales bacterium]
MQTSKHSQITQDIEAGIRSRRWRDKLPTVRELAAAYQVSSRTMQKALAPLRQSRLILPEGSRGSLINYSRQPRRHSGIIGIYANLRHQGVASDPLLSTLQTLVEESGYRPFFANMPAPELFDNEDFWRDTPLDGYIFVYSTIRMPLVSTLRMAGIPFVCANRLPERIPVSWVDFDHQPALRQVVEKLLQCGYRRLALYDRPSYSTHSDTSRNTWKKLMDELGVPRRHRYQVGGIRNDHPLQDLAQCLDTWYARSQPPQAIITWNSAADEAQKLLLQHKRTLPLLLQRRTYTTSL